MRKHLDLFSGIGGFAIAAQTVWPRIEHVFCDNDQFSQAILKKHWPTSKIYGDIKKLKGSEIGKVDLVTGGFPCQPFSQAGKRRGTEDNRHLWPQMLRIIQECRPTWVIAENVRGLVTWSHGMVLETVCADLERAGYEVQPIIIPAAGLGAPHRRERIWIIAHANRHSDGRIAREHASESEKKRVSKRDKMGKSCESSEIRNVSDSSSDRRDGKGSALHGRGERSPSEAQDDDADARRPRLQRIWPTRSRYNGFFDRTRGDQRRDWKEDGFKIAAELCGVDDGVPARLDRSELTKSAHREARLKSLGNAIVPEVAIEIMLAIKKTKI